MPDIMKAGWDKDEHESETLEEAKAMLKGGFRNVLAVEHQPQAL